MTDRIEHTDRLTRRLTLGEFVRREIPHLRIAVGDADLDSNLADARAHPEGVTGMVASRTVAGGALGALAGALLIGGTTALIANASATTVIVAALGGAFIGAVFGATWVVFAGVGGSDAYRQRFIAPELADGCIVSLHTDDADPDVGSRSSMSTSRLVEPRRSPEWVTLDW